MRGLVSLLLLSYRCIFTINVLWLYLIVSWVGLQYVIVVFPDHTHLLFPMKFQYPFLQISKGGRSSKAYAIFLMVRVYTLCSN